MSANNSLYSHGLVNFTGNNCWFNSTIQFLLGSTTLNKEVLKRNNGEFIIDNDKYYNEKMMRLYTATIKLCQINNADILDIKELMFNLSQNPDQVQSLMQQNDPSEFITLLIETLGDSIVKLFTHAFHNTIICGKHVHNKRDSNILLPVALRDMKNLQNYLVKHQEAINYNCDKTTIVPTSIKSDTERAVIENGNYSNTNDNTSNRKIIVRQMSLAPKVLIVMVKNYTEIHNYEPINYPEILTFPKNNSNSPWKYNVMSVIEHFGNKQISTIIRSSSGHYICTSKRNGGIYIHNDSSISPTFQFPVSPNICMILYEREE